jgi:hypothetical protein
MARTAGTPFAEELYEAVEPHAFADEANDWALWTLCQAIALQFDLVDTLVRATDDRPAWSVALDVDRTPATILPWLAYFVGDRLPATLAEQAARDRIRDARGLRRGRPATMVAAAQETLTGTKQVRLLERDTSAWHLTAITRTGETPNPAVTLAALMSQKPAGIVLAHIVSDAPIINEGTKAINSATGTIDTAVLADVT